MKRLSAAAIAVLAWAASNAANLLATSSLAMIGIGLWMAWPPLGLIVPGTIIFTALAYTRTRKEP